MKAFKSVKWKGFKNIRQSGHEAGWYYLGYTILFLGFMGVITAGYFMAGKSFVWGPNGDGMRQHYTSLAYFGEYLRGILTDIFVNHKFEIPMWDLHIGYGSDILTTLHYYTIGDPLNLLSVFVPERYTEYLYDFLVMLRIYLAGIAFSAYCRFHGNKNIPTLLGAVMYAFSGWIMLTGFKHPLFINPCIYFPLLLMGVDKIFKKQKPYVYMIMVGISAISNFYFFYMLVIFMVIYAVYRYLMLFHKIRIKEVLGWLGKFAGYGIIGLLFSGVIMLPAAVTLFGTDRIAADIYVQGLYPVKHYHMLPAMLTGKYLSKYTVVGVSVMALIGLIVLFMKRKKNTALKIGFLMCMVFFCIPYMAHVFNGFSYVTNRWSWVMVMLLSYIFVKAYPDIFALSKRQRLGLGLCAGVYCLYIFLDKYAGDIWNVITCAILVVTVVIVIGAYDFLKGRRTWQFLVFLCGMGVSIGVNMLFCFTSRGNSKSDIWSFVDAGKAYDTAHDSIQKRIAEQPDAGEYRYEQHNSGILFNSAILTGLNGGQFFYSMANGNVSRFLDENYSNRPVEQLIMNQDERSFLMKLLSMKYFVGEDKLAPYGFEKIDTVNKKLSLFEDKSALPMAYTYDSYIPAEEYEDMNAMERQQAMLQGVVLEESSLPEMEPEDTSVKVDYEITDLQDVELFDNRIKAKSDGASCVLKIKGLPQCETNVVMKNLKYLEVNRRHKYSDEEWKNLSLSQKYDIFVKDQIIDYEATIYFDTQADGQKIRKNIFLYTDKNNFYGGRHNFVSNLGYRQDGITYIKMTFSAKGSYQFDDMSVYCQPMDSISEYTSERKADKVEKLVIDGGNVSCRVNLDAPRALVFSLPYSKGWSAVVDGREAELKQANTMFLAVELPPGEHEIELHYTTPYIKWGLLLSASGVVLFIAVLAVQKKKKRKTA